MPNLLQILCICVQNIVDISRYLVYVINNEISNKTHTHSELKSGIQYLEEETNSIFTSENELKCKIEKYYPKNSKIKQEMDYFCENIYFFQNKMIATNNDQFLLNI